MSYIPKNIVYICKTPVHNKQFNINLVEAFVTDPTNQKTIQTGTEWALQWDYKSGKYINQNPKQIITLNDPISNIKLIELDHRGRGGRAYKIIANGFYVDLREDIMMDCLLNEGCVGGVLLAQLAWARIGSQMKLIRVGSELYKSLK